MKKTLLLTGLFLVFLLSPAIFSQERADSDTPNKYLLRMRFTPGQTYCFRITSEQKFQAMFMAKPQNWNILAVAETSFYVGALNPDGSAAMTATITSLVLKADSADEHFKFDSSSANNGTNQITKAFSAVLNKGFLMRVSANGSIDEIKGLSNLVNQAAASILEDAKIKADPIKLSLIKLGQDLLSDENLKDMAKGFIMSYPEKPVQSLQTWSDVYSISKDIPTIVSNTYQVSNADDKTITISVDSAIGTDKKQAEGNPGAAKIKFDITGRRQGTVAINTQTGWLLNANCTQSFSGTVTMAGEGSSITCPVSGNGRLIITQYAESSSQLKPADSPSQTPVAPK